MGQVFDVRIFRREADGTLHVHAEDGAGWRHGVRLEAVAGCQGERVAMALELLQVAWEEQSPTARGVPA